MDDDEKNETKDLVVPVVSEELHADAAPVVTGGVRVTKHLHTDNETLQQELRKSHAEVKRVKTNRLVDGPQPVQRVGNTVVIPVVSEVLRVERQWVVTEEIHIIETEASETVEQTVPVRHEEAQIERLDASGNPISVIEPTPESAAAATAPGTGFTPSTGPTSRTGPAPLIQRSGGATPSRSGRRVRSILKPETGDR